MSTYEGTLDPIAAQIIINECYDDLFGVYNSSSQGNSPYASAAMHEAEDMGRVDPFDLYLERYLVSNVLKYTGTTLDAFLDMPKNRAEALMSRCEAIAAKEDKEVDTLMNGGNNSNRGKKRFGPGGK